MMRTCFLIPCLLAMALTWAAPAPARGATTEGSLKSYRGIIHVHSNFSTGELSPAEVVAKAKKAGIKIVVFTDHDLVRASWGLPPFRNLLSWITPQPLDEWAALLKLCNRLSYRGFFIVANHVDEKAILPSGFPARTRFNLTQVQSAFSEND